MSRRFPLVILLGALAFCAACTNKKVNNPLANVGSKQPDKVLFDRAMDAMKHNRFDVARMTLQTLINTYPDSEFIARAKLAVGDSWYAEGGTAALSQAEIEYKDFETFFPNMPEAAEAQLKIANIHYQQMEKPDRDYTHAKRAEDEYRALILQYPDSKLLPEAKQRLMEVQEVLGEREFEIGRFYYLRQSYPAAIARLASLVDRYPLYSGADETLYLLGEAYEAEVTILRSRQFNETQKAQMIEAYTKRAADAYSKIITRYPVMERAPDAKRRLEALHRPVPTPTQAAIAQNKAEEESRKTTGMVSKVVAGFKKHPDVARSTKVGEPPLVDPKGMSATDVPKIATEALMAPGKGGDKAISIEIPKEGAPMPGANAAVPRSDAPNATTEASTGEAGTSAPPAPAADANELKPNTAPDPNELKVENPEGGQSVPPPAQVNEIQSGAAGQTDTAASSSSSAPSGATSTSKKKKKKGLGKLNPF
jgi:outer membrane protein assembly factor BamD